MADLNDIKLSAQDILKKKFRNKVKGYDPDEVDSYLDQIISDYETFQDIIEDLYGRIGELQGQVIDAEKQVKQEEQAVKEIPAAVPASATTESKEEDVKTYVPSSQRQRADFSWITAALAAKSQLTWQSFKDFQPWSGRSTIWNKEFTEFRIYKSKESLL